MISYGYKYRGQFVKKLSYTRGDIVEEGSSIYVCLLDYSPKNSDDGFISPFYSKHEWVSVPIYKDLDSNRTAIAEPQSLADEYAESSISNNKETNLAVLMYHYFNNEDD